MINEIINSKPSTRQLLLFEYNIYNLIKESFDKEELKALEEIERALINKTNKIKYIPIHTDSLLHTSYWTASNFPLNNLYYLERFVTTIINKKEIDELYKEIFNSSLHIHETCKICNGNGLQVNQGESNNVFVGCVMCNTRGYITYNYLTKHNTPLQLKQMTQEIYASKRLGDVGILTDYIEEHGTEELKQHALEHLRSNAEHPIGCYVLEAILHVN